MAQHVVVLRLERATEIPNHIDPKAFLESIFGRPLDAVVASETADKDFLGAAILQIPG